MKNHNNFIKILTLLICVSILHSCISNTKNKVLIIGIDGCRPDALLKANTPTIDSLWKNGAYSFSAQTDEISYSGPGWTGMLTGVWHNKHNVTDNKYTNPNITEYPHFFHRIKQQDSTLRCYSITHWEPLNSILQKGDADVASDFETDEEVTRTSSQLLATEVVDAMFVHLDNVDHIGHSTGFSLDNPEYIEAIELQDENVGRILSGLKQRKNFENENWLILISTDHGGSGTKHGKNIPEHTTIFFIANGKSVPKRELKTQVNIVDIAATALHHLNIKLKDEWKLDGKNVLK